MAVPMSWAFFAVLLFGYATTKGSDDFIETELFIKMKKDLVELCPKTDICNRNTSAHTDLQNELNAGNNDACCQSCSCHESCYANMNCCFPDDADDMSGVENKLSSIDCLYVRTGKPGKSWTNTVPAYRIVSSEPQGGCLPYMLSESPVRHDLKPSCDNEPVAVWGNLFPVYSQEHNKIYKNAECALCHNATNIINWSPILFCKDTNKRLISVSQILQFLALNLQTANCYVAFRYKDPSILTNKRCYKEPVSTCPLTSQIDTISTRIGTDLVTKEIWEACENGFESTFKINTVAYRNIYCYFCNVPDNLSRNNLVNYCQTDADSRNSIPGQFSLLLEAEYFNIMHSDGRSDEKMIFPQACIMSGQSLASDICRDILCPSGQIRTTLTDCKFPSTKYYVDAVVISLRLGYSDEPGSILRLFKRGTVKQSDIKDGLLENTPWSSQWNIWGVHHTNESLSEKSLSVLMVSKINSPEELYHSIKRSIAKPWAVYLNGSSFNLKQSFFEYTLIWKPNKAIPSWFKWANSASLLLTNISDIDSFTMHAIYKSQIRLRPRALPKLLVCEQISLYNGEFILIANNLVLISNLTIRTLYDREFELVYDSDNTVSVRVCASDTVLQTKTKTNGSHEELLVRSMISFLIVFVVRTFV